MGIAILILLLLAIFSCTCAFVRYVLQFKAAAATLQDAIARDDECGAIDACHAVVAARTGAVMNALAVVVLVLLAVGITTKLL